MTLPWDKGTLANRMERGKATALHFTLLLLGLGVRSGDSIDRQPVVAPYNVPKG